VRPVCVLALALVAGCSAGTVGDDFVFDDDAYQAAQAGCAGGKCDSAADWSSDRLAPVGPAPPVINARWDDATLDRWNHADQGVVLIPLSWLFAVERADSSTPFFTRELAERYGFPADRVSAANPAGLPIGFTSHTQNGTRYLGFACAACHTAELSVNGATVRIAGGHGRADFDGFARALEDTFRANLVRPDKAYRMIGRIVRAEGLGQSLQIARDLFGALKQAAAASFYTSDLYPVPPGPGRLDAAGQGGNRLFGQGIDARNYTVASSNTNIPALWDVPRYDWSHYTGAIRQNLARNTVEALGVGAQVNLFGGSGRVLESTVDIDALVWLEAATRELESPVWPAELGPLDDNLVARGRALYQESCGGCHGELAADPQHPNRIVPFPSDYGVDGDIGLRYFATADIGTDASAAAATARRTVLLSPALNRLLGVADGTPVKAMAAFAAVTGGVGDVYFDEHGVDASRRDELRHHRPNLWRAPLAYRARPLNGIWSHAPFLHNGSVRSLTELLGPAGARASVFQVGSSVLDPATLGYDGGTFTYDTRLPGNGNAGHVFDDVFDPSRPFTAQAGVVGRALAPDEIRALVELMKALEPLD
jgi:mono/diheme cytochrome c family protein